MDDNLFALLENEFAHRFCDSGLDLTPACPECFGSPLSGHSIQCRRRERLLLARVARVEAQRDEALALCSKMLGETNAMAEVIQWAMKGIHPAEYGDWKAKAEAAIKPGAKP